MILIWLVFWWGGEVESIYTAGSVRVDPEIGKAGDLDTVLIVLQFKNGVIGTIDNSRKAAYGYDQRVETLGSNGAIATENCYPNQALSTPAAIRRDLPWSFLWTVTQRASSASYKLSYEQCCRTSQPRSMGWTAELL
jgi:predicted dehydrogenase